MPKILVVEDEVDLCNLIKSHLETEGHTVAQAFDGPSALALVTGVDVFLDMGRTGLNVFGNTLCVLIVRRFGERSAAAASLQTPEPL